MRIFQKIITRVSFLLCLPFFFGCSDDVPTQGTNTTFVWDFSKPKKYVYHLKRMTKSDGELEDIPLGDRSKDEQIMTADLTVKVKKNKAADIILSNTKVSKSSMFKGRELAAQNRLLSKKIQISYQDYPADGRVEHIGQELGVGSWFPLPPYDFAPGGSAKLSLKIPFHANGSLLFLRGTNTLKYLRKEKKDGRNCAVIRSKVEVSDLTVPEELAEEHQCSFKGEGIYYFDYENHCFVSGKATISADSFSKIKRMPGSDLSEMKLKVKYTVEYRLVEIKE